MTPQDRINSARIEINELDTALLSLLNRRMSCVKLIGEAKKEIGLEVYVPSREQIVMDRLRPDEEFDGLVDTVWPVIMGFARSIQN